MTGCPLIADFVSTRKLAHFHVIFGNASCSNVEAINARGSFWYDLGKLDQQVAPFVDL